MWKTLVFDITKKALTSAFGALFTKFNSPEFNPALTEAEETLTNSKGWRAGHENPKYVLLIIFALLTTGMWTHFLQLLGFVFILANTISKALQQLNRLIHLNKLFPDSVGGLGYFLLLLFCILNLPKTLPHPGVVIRDTKACLSLILTACTWKKDLWDKHIFSISLSDTTELLTSPNPYLCWCAILIKRLT